VEEAGQAPQPRAQEAVSPSWLSPVQVQVQVRAPARHRAQQPAEAQPVP